MRLLSINVGRPRLATFNSQTFSTAIYKTAVDGPVALRLHNLEGDRQASLDVHGGPNKAVYAYPSEHYGYWAEVLDRADLTPGQFGENFTTRGLVEDNVHIGDVFRVGSASVQVTQPRVPCRNLAARMQDAGFPKVFLGSGRSGFYLRVIDEGVVAAGDAIERIAEDPARLSVRAIHTLRFVDTENKEAIRQAIAVEALSDEWRRELQAML